MDFWLKTKIQIDAGPGYRDSSTKPDCFIPNLRHLLELTSRYQTSSAISMTPSGLQPVRR